MELEPEAAITKEQSAADAALVKSQQSMKLAQLCFEASQHKDAVAAASAKAAIMVEVEASRE